MKTLSQDHQPVLWAMICTLEFQIQSRCAATHLTAVFSENDCMALSKNMETSTERVDNGTLFSPFLLTQWRR
jgi:hypothetical protein